MLMDAKHPHSSNYVLYKYVLFLNKKGELSDLANKKWRMPSKN